MTSFDTPSGQRAALISPGSALAPQNTEARTEYLQQRLRLLSRLVLSLGGFFLFAGVVHRFVFFHEGPLARLSPEPALLTHLAVLSLQGLLWLTLRKKRWSVRQLHGLDAALLLGTLAGIAFQFQHLKLGQQHQTHLLIVLATLALSLCRAVIVPSTPLATLAVSLLATAPALWVATREGGAGAGYEVVSFTAIWSVATVALATFTSSVLYGLRCRVREAQLGQYVIERKLGEGGMGEVYLARHSLLRRPTAIKLLPPERVGHQTVRRFEREVRATSRLTHPNTVAIYDYGRTAEGTFYYAMEYLEGCDLQRLVRDVGPLPPARVVHILDQVAGALAEAHNAGLVHRDLKPANVFLCERGGVPDTVKVLDFGLVKDTGNEAGASGNTDVNVLMGTPAYLSPESIHSPSEVDARSDLYAVGALAYFLLTGREVFHGTSVVALCVAHLHERPAPPSQRLGRALPGELERLVLRCLEKAPENRPQSALELKRALAECLLPVWAATPQPPLQKAIVAASGAA